MKFNSFRGASLKLWDYFRHVLAAPGFTARVSFTADSRWNETNPWFNVPEYVVADANSVRADAFFVSGRHWALAERHPDWGDGAPVINLIQHVKHATVGDERFQYLPRPAIRICVAPEVETAIVKTGIATRPIMTIPNGIDLAMCAPGKVEHRPWDVLIAALKRPDLGAALLTRLQEEGHTVLMLDKPLSRPAYLAALRSARVTVLLPNDTEGFYLPALEGLAAETLVVCPDCVGNRSFCLPGTNAFMPAFNLDALAEAARTALSLSKAEADRFRTEGRRTAQRHSLEVERSAFHKVLQNLDAYWATALRDRPAQRRPDAITR